MIYDKIKLLCDILLQLGKKYKLEDSTCIIL